MTRTTRQVMVGIMMTGLVGAGRPAFAAGAETPAVSRVRSGSVAITALIQQASERSKTFRGLVEAINASDGIVYVQEGSCGHGVRACFVNVTASGPNRILLVKVKITGQADWELMGSIGHELRHTIEVLSDRTVTSHDALYFFYQQVGSNGMRAFETAAAVKAGDVVGAELRHWSPPTDAR